MQTFVDKVLFLKVAFTDGTEREFAILGSMPMVKFAQIIQARFPDKVLKKTTFLDAPLNPPRVVELL